MNDLRRAWQRLFRRYQSRHSRKSEPLREAATTPLPASIVRAKQRLVDREFCRSKTFQEMKTRTPMGLAHPALWLFKQRLQKEFHSQGIPMYAFEIYRTPERQEVLLTQGVTKAGPWRSPHQFGCAVDFIHCERLWDLTRDEWTAIGLIGKEVARKMSLKVTWGGDWSFYDPAHWELEGWRIVRDKAGRIVSRPEPRIREAQGFLPLSAAMRKRVDSLRD